MSSCRKINAFARAAAALRDASWNDGVSLTVTFADDSTDAECDGFEFVADVNSNLTTTIEMSAYAVDAGSDEDVDFVEALELCLDPDYIGTEHDEKMKKNGIENETKQFEKHLALDFIWNFQDVQLLRNVESQSSMSLNPYKICSKYFQQNVKKIDVKTLTVLIAIGCGGGWYDCNETKNERNKITIRLNWIINTLCDGSKNVLKKRT